MLRWLWKIFVGNRPCEHVWEAKSRVSIFDPDRSMETPVGIKVHLRCTKCGDWKGVTL